MGNIPRDARLLFILLWTIADDHGRLRGHPRFLAHRLFPYDIDAEPKIIGWLQSLEAEGCISLYSHGRAQYIAITNWKLHQKIDHPGASKIPEPPEVGQVRLPLPELSPPRVRH
jgi:hypothetical protein